MRRSRLSRLARGTMAAVVATFVALLSHVTAGGALPGWLGLVTPLVLSIAVCTLLAGRRLSIVRLSVAVIASQALFHTLFVLGAFSVPAGMSSSHHAGHVMPAVSDAPALTADVMLADPVMWAGHVVAAFVTILALHRGEHTLRQLIALVRAGVEVVLLRLVGVLALIETPARRVAADCVAAGPLALWRDILLSTTPRRGPPLAHAV